MTLEGVLAHGRQVLAEAGIEDSSLGAWYLFGYVGEFDKG